MEPIEAKIRIGQSDRTMITNIEKGIDGYWIHFGSFRWPIFFSAMPSDWSKGDLVKISFEKIHVSRE